MRWALKPREALCESPTNTIEAVGQILLESYAALNPDCKHLTIPLALAYQEIMFRSHERLTVRGTPA